MTEHVFGEELPTRSVSTTLATAKEKQPCSTDENLALPYVVDAKKRY
jgi:hypothetical protein